MGKCGAFGELPILIVSLKILPPTTSAVKYLCGSSYNSIDEPARAWYLELEREIESLTIRTLKFLNLTLRIDFKCKVKSQ